MLSTVIKRYTNTYLRIEIHVRIENIVRNFNAF